MLSLRFLIAAIFAGLVPAVFAIGLLASVRIVHNSPINPLAGAPALPQLAENPEWKLHYLLASLRINEPPIAVTVRSDDGVVGTRAPVLVPAELSVREMPRVEERVVSTPSSVTPAAVPPQEVARIDQAERLPVAPAEPPAPEAEETPPPPIEVHERERGLRARARRTAAYQPIRAEDRGVSVPPAVAPAPVLTEEVPRVDQPAALLIAPVAPLIVESEEKPITKAGKLTRAERKAAGRAARVKDGAAGARPAVAPAPAEETPRIDQTAAVPTAPVAPTTATEAKPPTKAAKLTRAQQKAAARAARAKERDVGTPAAAAPAPEPTVEAPRVDQTAAIPTAPATPPAAESEEKPPAKAGKKRKAAAQKLRKNRRATAAAAATRRQTQTLSDPFGW